MSFSCWYTQPFSPRMIACMHIIAEFLPPLLFQEFLCPPSVFTLVYNYLPVLLPAIAMVFSSAATCLLAEATSDLPLQSSSPSPHSWRLQSKSHSRSLRQLYWLLDVFWLLPSHSLILRKCHFIHSLYIRLLEWCSAPFQSISASSSTIFPNYMFPWIRVP